MPGVRKCTHPFTLTLQFEAVSELGNHDEEFAELQARLSLCPLVSAQTSIQHKPSSPTLPRAMTSTHRAVI
jgi:hypothetical protein